MGIEVLDQQERHACVGRHGAEEAGEGVQAAGGRADGDGQERQDAGRGRASAAEPPDWPGRLPRTGGRADVAVAGPAREAGDSGGMNGRGSMRDRAGMRNAGSAGAAGAWSGAGSRRRLVRSGCGLSRPSISARRDVGALSRFGLVAGGAFRGDAIPMDIAPP